MVDGTPIESESSPQVNQEPVAVHADDDNVLDTVLNNTDKLCCGFRVRGVQALECAKNGELIHSSTSAPNAPGGDIEGGLQVKKEASGSPDDNFALDDVPDEPELSEMAMDPSLEKETVEVQANFGDEEDGHTLSSDNGQDNGIEIGKGGFGRFVDTANDADINKSSGRRRWTWCIACFIVLLVLVAVVALSLGLTQDKSTRESSFSEINDSESATSSPTFEETWNATFSPTFTDVANTTSSPTIMDFPTPTTAPTTGPTTGSTSSPTVISACIDTISVESTCYEYWAEPVVVDFTICDPNSGDWIALYPEGSDPAALGAPVYEWNYSCGTRECAGATSGNSFEMSIATPPGRYQAFVIKNEDGLFRMPYEAVAISEPFEVSTTPCA